MISQKPVFMRVWGNHMKIYLLLFLSVILTSSLMAEAIQAASFGNDIADDVIAELQTMKGVYEAEYAPAQWKKTFANYDLETQYNKAVAAVQTSPNLTRNAAREIFKNFIYAMKDYHTSISFVATEQATLPFVVKGTANRFFIVYIDRNKLPAGSFPFQVGDELVTFDGKSAAQAVADVQNQIPPNVASTDRALAELRLTSRKASAGLDVPQGPVTIGVRSQGSGTVSQTQLVWEYTPEKISERPRIDAFEIFPDKPMSLSSIFHPEMDVDVASSLPADTPYTIGATKTWTPNLGPKLWQSAADDFFYAYAYRTPDRKIIGYIRIASYEAPDFLKAVAEFQRDVTYFEQNTDGLIIDQVDNPGGSVMYLYSLASMLANQPLTTPKHRMSITQADVASAVTTSDFLKNVKTDDDAKKAIPAASLQGYPVSYEFSQFYLNFSNFIMNEWNSGRKLTNPFWIAGVDHINPAPVHYTKPILLLVNSLDFSGGDFFPAIMQDNKRVTVFGTRTAGAGGYVADIQVPNDIGIDKFRCTESIASRADQNPIENLGVKPDVEYSMTEADFSQNYTGYVKAIQKALGDLVK